MVTGGKLQHRKCQSPERRCSEQTTRQSPSNMQMSNLPSNPVSISACVKTLPTHGRKSDHANEDNTCSMPNHEGVAAMQSRARNECTALPSECPTAATHTADMHRLGHLNISVPVQTQPAALITFAAPGACAKPQPQPRIIEVCTTSTISSASYLQMRGTQWRPHVGVTMRAGAGRVGAHHVRKAVVTKRLECVKSIQYIHAHTAAIVRTPAHPGSVGGDGGVACALHTARCMSINQYR